MEFIRPGTNIDFMGRRKLAISISLALMLISALSLVVRGLNLGIDFKGGTKLIAAFAANKDVDRGRVRKVVARLVEEKTGQSGTQVEVQDLALGTGEEAAARRRYVIYTEVTSLLTPEKKKALIDELRKKLGEGVTVEAVEEGEDKFYITWPKKGPVLDRYKALEEAFKAAGYPHVAVGSDAEETLDMEFYRTLTLVEQDKRRAGDQSASPFEKSLEEFNKEKQARLAKMEDRYFTVTVQEFRKAVDDALHKEFGKDFIEVESALVVSPSVGRDLLMNGLVAILYALIGILLYIALRFDFRYSPGAVFALFHDSLITIGVFSLFQLKFTEPIIAAVLTIIGYSLNDTIVVYDRIREMVKRRRRQELSEVINRSINDTLSRTILTSFTTLIVVIAILVLGGGLIRDFALALFVGITVGTYSSIFIASPLVIYLDAWFKRREEARAARAPTAAAPRAS